MKDKIKSAFDSIHVEDSLKATTLRNIYAKRQNALQPKRSANIKRLIPAAASIVFLMFSGIFSYKLYFTETAYIDFDINPSLSFGINRFERIINVETYNDDAAKLLSNIKTQYKKVDIVLDELISAAAETGLLQKEGLVSVTVQSLEGDNEKLLLRMQTDVTASVSHHSSAEIDVFSVDKQTRRAAHKLHITPAKYLAILELQEVDPTTSFDHCRKYGIGEIRRLTRQHKKYHRQNCIKNENRNREQNEASDTRRHHKKKEHKHMQNKQI